MFNPELQEYGTECPTLCKSVRCRGAAIAMALEKNQGILGEVARTIDDVTNCLQQGSKLIVATQEIGALVMAAAGRALQVQQDIQNEEIKRIYQVDKALKDLVLVAEKAFIFLNKVDDVVWYCGGDAMAAAREDLRFSVDLHQSEGFWLVPPQ